MDRIGVAVIGAGYWGPNLIRNFSASPQVDLRWVCDRDVGRAESVVGRYSTIRTTASLADVLDDSEVQAVAIATPAATHTALALAAIDSGRHVLIEKPLAPTVAEGERLVAAADASGVVLMCDHTYCFTPTVQKIRDLVRGGDLGEVQYVDSVRINLGLVQPDVDVLWDLAPHDLSVLDLVLPEELRPTAVSAVGADPVGAGRACLAYLTLPLPNGGLAHAHVNWLSPTKIRTTVIGGSRKMLVWDDLHPTQRLSVYDKGIDLSGREDLGERVRNIVSYRVGEMVSPALTEREALRGVVEEFATSIRERRAALTDGRAGLRVLRVLEAASSSLAEDGRLVPVRTPQADPAPASGPLVPPQRPAEPAHARVTEGTPR